MPRGAIQEEIMECFRVYFNLGWCSADVRAENARRLWLRGGFPLSYLAKNDARSFDWRAAFVDTFLQRDLPQLGIRVAAETLHRFWTMLAHTHGQTWNSSSMAGNFGVADTTVRGWLDHLVSALVVRILRPWHENLAKRQVKSPKVYIADSGMLHALLNIRTHDDLMGSPKVGASWEGYAIGQVARRLSAGPEECFFWATHQNAELDLLIVRGRRRLGFEMKLAEAPTVTKSMRIAMADLKLDRLDVIHAGKETYPMAEGIRAVSLERIGSDLERLPGGPWA
jgi:predicted AAA+ superfamily ATPase